MPLPAKGVPEAVVGVLPVLVVVVVVVLEPDLGRYLTPVAGQSELEPSGVEVSGVDMRWGIEEGVTWIGRDEGARLHAALDVVEVPNFVELIRVLALDHGSDASR